MTKLLPFFIFFVILVLFYAPADAAQVEEYSVVFQEINGSGVSGKGSLTFDGDRLSANIRASGLVANQFHGLHIHTIQGQDLKCPPDANGDGYMSHDEVHRDFGGHALELTPYPTADASGNISFDQSYTEDLDKLEPLEGKFIFIHGTNVEGKYDGDVAVGCGEIEPAGTASSSSSPGGASSFLLPGLALVAASLALLAAMVSLARRNGYLNRG